MLGNSAKSEADFIGILCRSLLAWTDEYMYCGLFHSFSLLHVFSPSCLIIITIVIFLL